MRELRRRQQAGFSMVELVVVTSIVLIGAGMAAVQIRSSLPAMRANAAMNQVVSQMSIARGMAIAQRRSVSVIFTQPNRIQLRRQDQPGGTTDFTPVDFEGGAQFVVFQTVPDTPSGFGNSSAIVFAGINGGPPTMQFQSDGTFADTAGQPINGTIFVGIPGQSATARAVTILGATGRVRPYHWTGSQWSE